MSLYPVSHANKQCYVDKIILLFFIPRTTAWEVANDVTPIAKTVLPDQVTYLDSDLYIQAVTRLLGLCRSFLGRERTRSNLDETPVEAGRKAVVLNRQ